MSEDTKLGPVHPDLVKAGYVRPSVETYVGAGKQYTAENYAAHFTKYEADILPDVQEGKIVFAREMPEEAEVIEAEVAPTELPPTPPTPKPRRPSFQYPGFYEPE